MKYSLRVLMVLWCCLMPVIGNAAGLSGSMSVNQTSDTAANAKINAMNRARRQILSDVLSQYSAKDSLTNCCKKLQVKI